MTVAAALGLRDRKRLQTRTRLQEVAVELALRDGIQHATIEAICEVADVSPRTFFNYFESKEDALLGLPDIEVSQEAVLARSHGGDVVDDLIGFMIELSAPIFENRSLHKARTEILKRNPELFGRHLARMTRLTDDLNEAVNTLMSGDPRFAYLAGAASPLAELILALCTSAVRIAAKEWIAAGSGAPIDDIRLRAVALTREAVRRLT